MKDELVLHPSNHGGDDHAWPLSIGTRVRGRATPARFGAGQGAAARDIGDDDGPVARRRSVRALGHLRAAVPPIARGAAASGAGTLGRPTGGPAAATGGTGGHRRPAPATGSYATGATRSP